MRASMKTVKKHMLYIKRIKGYLSAIEVHFSGTDVIHFTAYFLFSVEVGISYLG